jgi:thiol-disulfide isomerase/thioredoxin
MRVEKLILKLFIALCVVLPGTLLSPNATAELLPHEGMPEPPSLELPDLGGQRHTLDAYRGQVVLVNFWASWCAPCLVEMPSMQRLKTAMAGRPFDILAVNVKESKSKAWRFKKLLNVSFTTLLDSDGAASEAWDVNFYPTSYLIDGAGQIRYSAYGAIKWDDDETLQLIEGLMPDGKARQRLTSADRSR